MSPQEPESDNRQGWTGPIEWMARNSIAANLLMVILLGGGIWMAINIQKEVFPPAQLDVVSVSVTYPGASPSEVEQGILLPVEEAVRGIQGVNEITSTAREGSGDIQLELIPGTNRMKAFQDIDQAVSRIRTFPDEAEEPDVELQARERSVMELGLYGDVDIWTLRKLAERLRDRLLNNNSITQVEIGNVPGYLTHVEISQDRLRAHDLTLTEVAQTIEQSSQDVPAGSIETSSGEILLRMKERKQWAEQFETIPIIQSESGSSLQLGQIADIKDGFEEAGFHSEFNRQPSVEIEIFRVGSQSPLEIAASVRSIMDDYQKTLPPGVQYRIDSNMANDYQERLSLLLKNGFLAIFIVLIILGLFLEYRLAFWVMMGMAISFIGGVLFLPMFGISINMISMFAFLVVLGIVVDDAIIVGENVYEYREQGMDFMTAAIKGTRDIAGPVTFSILTNIVAFIPLMFVPGTMGNFFWPIPVVVITVLAISLFEALFILPAHLGHSSENSATSIGKFIHHWQQEFAAKFNRWVDQYYRPFLELSLRFRYITLCSALTLLAIVGAYAMSGHMGIIAIPSVSADEIEAGVSLPVATTREQAARTADRITRATHEMYQRNNLDRAAEGIKTNVRGQSFIDVEIVMKPSGERDMTVDEVIKLWRNEIGDIEGVDQITFEAESGPGGWRDDISVDLSHSNINTLENASQEFFRRVQQFEATQDVNDNYERGKPQFNFHLRPAGESLGFTASNLGRQIRSAFFGSDALRQLRGTNEVEVRVKRPESERQSMYFLNNLIVHSPAGTEVPLMEVARVDRGVAFNSIDRRNGRRVITVGMDVEPSRATNRVLNSIQNEILPQLRTDFPGITWSFQGSQAEMNESTRTLWGGFMLAMAVVYSLLAIAFRSYVQPLIVMSAIPFGIIGAVIGHILLGYNLSIMSMMGVIALSGVVVNDSLIMVDYANRQRSDHSAFESIHRAGIRRFRPILLTTLTTFGGLTPIILETSRQAMFLIPMAISLGFGILFATSIILVLVPSLYMLLEDVVNAVDPYLPD